MQGNKTGRLLKFSPQSKTTSFVSGGIHYANGVALGPEEASVLVVETSHLRVLRHWLKGPKVSPSDKPRGCQTNLDLGFWRFKPSTGCSATVTSVKRTLLGCLFLTCSHFKEQGTRVSRADKGPENMLLM